VIGAQLNTGFMTVSDGGAVKSNLAVVGFTSTARGVVEVTDPGSTWTNTSSLSVGQEGEGELTIANGGSVSNTFGFIGFLGGQATVTVDGDGSSWTNSENVFIGANGALNIRNGGRVDSEKSMIINGGTVTLEEGQLKSNAITLNSGSFNFTGGRLSVGTFQEDLTQDGGVLAAGDSPGGTAIMGDYTLNSGALEVELAGLLQGNEYDYYDVAGDVNLTGGSLAVVLLAPFTLGANQYFDMLSVGGSLTGQFDGLGEGGLVGNFGGTALLITYAAGDGNDIALFTANSLAGDYNDDGVVDAADYTVWRDNLGALAGTLPNDVDGDVIGQPQYNTWVANFGSTTEVGSSSLSNLPVPEPATAMLLMTIAAGTWLRRRSNWRVPILGAA